MAGTPEGIRSAAEHTGAGWQYGSPVIHCCRHTQLYPIQDYTNYDVRTHHTNMDTADRLSVNDIRQAALMIAAFAYNASMTDAPFPRPGTK